MMEEFRNLQWSAMAIMSIVGLAGCGQSNPPPMLSTATTSAFLPRLTIHTWKVEGNEVYDAVWEIDRGKSQEVTADVHAGTWGLSQIVGFEFVPSDRPLKPKKPRKVHPIVKDDPVLNFILMVYRGKQADPNKVTQMVMGSFTPGERPDEGSLSYFVKIDEPGEYLMQFNALDSSKQTASGGNETVALREQRLNVR